MAVVTAASGPSALVEASGRFRMLGCLSEFCAFLLYRRSLDWLMFLVRQGIDGVENIDSTWF